MRFSALVAAAVIAPLLAAYAWSQSEMADDYRANKIAQEEAAKLGLPLDYEAARRPKKKMDECG